MIGKTPERLRAIYRDRSFTSDEAIAFTGVDKFTFRNWLKRGIVEIGEKHRLGRWLFSAVDMIRLSTLVDLVENIGMSPSLAREVCDEVVKLLDFFVDAAVSDHTNGVVRPHPLPAPLDHYVIVVVVRKDKLIFQHAFRRGAELVFVQGTPTNLVENQERVLPVLSVTHVVVAAGLIVDDILEKVKRAIDQDGLTGGTMS